VHVRPLPNTSTSGVLLIAGGLAASGLVHSVLIPRNRPFIAAIGMSGAALLMTGLAKLIHGGRIRIGEMTPLMRRYAVAAAVVGVAHLFLMRFFVGAESFDGVVVLLIVGLLCFGRPRASTQGASPSGEASSVEPSDQGGGRRTSG
jgi:hypothetical protein